MVVFGVIALVEDHDVGAVCKRNVAGKGTRCWWRYVTHVTVQSYVLGIFSFGEMFHELGDSFSPCINHRVVNRRVESAHTEDAVSVLVVVAALSVVGESLFWVRG